MKQYNNWRFLLVSDCNAKCFFCHKDGAHNQGKMLNIKTINDVLEKYGSEINKIRLAGGEPLLHPHIFEIIENCSKTTKDIGLVTNGILLKKYFDKIIASKLNKITISIHAYDEKKYTSITKINNAFKEIITMIKKLSKYKKVKINAVILKDINTSNEAIKELIDFCIKYNLDIEFIELDLGTLEDIDFDKYHYSPEKLKNKVESIYNIKMNYSEELCNYITKINNSLIEIHKSLCYNKLCQSCSNYRPIIVYPNGTMNRCRIGESIIKNIDIEL